jgi:phosphoribosylformylglycinamidine synthase subunit PurQ / glutaminase
VGVPADEAAVFARDILEPLGAAAQAVGPERGSLAAANAVVVAGAPGCGAPQPRGLIAARSSPLASALREFAAAGGPVLGICGGFALLCEWGLLDGLVRRNEPGAGAGSVVHVLVEGRPTPFTWAIPAGRHLRLTGAHPGASYAHPDPEALEAESRVVFRYCTADGEVSPALVGGSVRGIAGVCNREGNVVGVMHHPERHDDQTGNVGEQGRAVFAALLAWSRGMPGRV